MKTFIAFLLLLSPCLGVCYGEVSSTTLRGIYLTVLWDGPTFDKCIKWEDEIVVIELTDNKGQKTGLQESKSMPVCKESRSYQIGYRSDGIVAWREVKK